jgi:hypothetical protein
MKLALRSLQPEAELAIIEQPVDVQIPIGEQATISVVARGEGLTYQWYYKNKEFQDFKLSGYKGSVYSLTMNEYCNGRQVYCVITDRYGNSVTSETATMTRPVVELKILEQPKDVQTPIGESCTVTVAAQGEGLTYKWYYKNKNCQDFAVSGFKGNMYSLTMNEYCNGRQVYCVITDQYGNSVKTDIAVLHKAESDN